MNKIRVFFYSLKQGCINLARNWFIILSSIFVMFASFLILGSLFLLSYNVSEMLEKQSIHTEIGVDCEVAVTDEASMAIELIINNDSRVESVTRISKAENLQKMLEIFEYDEDLFLEYAQDESFMHVSFVIEMKDVKDIEGFAEDVKKIGGIDATSVTHNLSVYEYFTTINLWVKVISGVALVILGFISVLLCINTIRLTVFTRRKELEIMRVLGAPNIYIKGPFVMEGVIIGMVSSLLSLWAVKGIYGLLANYLESTPGALQSYVMITPFDDMVGWLLLIFLSVGVIVGVLAGVAATEKYLEK